MIEVRHLNKTYDRGSRAANHVLRDVSFTLPDTGFVCIVGPSGCGKTSLLNAVGGLDSFDSGAISAGDVTVTRCGTREMERERNSSFGYIFQNYYLLPEHSVAYNVYLGLHALNLTHRERLERVREALKAVNMARYARRAVGELSGGQQQRVAIARALARRPRVIFADEPTGNLDEENTVNICTLLRRISKTSLVVMVTHEEDIARFFADRIITIWDGVLAGDEESWQREGLTAEGGSALYAGDYEEQILEGEGVRLRLLRQEGAPPAELTVAVLADRVVIKVADSRAVSCARPEEAPALREGRRPVLTLESVDNDPLAELSGAEEPAAPGKAGGGLTPAMMAREAVNLLWAKGKRRVSTWIFLAAATVLTTWLVGDYLTVSSVDPRDFVITDSHILELSLERGPELPVTARGGVLSKLPEFLEYLEQSGLDFDYVPNVSSQLSCSVGMFRQTRDLTVALPGFSYAPLSRLDESDLVFGRMPETRDEVVIDRWVVEQLMAQDGLVQNGITDVSQMLGARLSYLKKNYSPTVVGICDKGEPTLYLSDSALVTVGAAGSDVIALSEFRAAAEASGDWIWGQVLEETDPFRLEEDQCFVNPNVVGAVYSGKIGNVYTVGSAGTFTIKNTVYVYGDMPAFGAVVPDGAVEELLRNMICATSGFSIYCEDKAAMKEYLAQDLPEGLEGQMLLTVKDANGDAWARYEAASHMKADARTIVTATVLVLCMVMLYLLQRSCVQQRIGMMAVYRLLGIPRRKLLAIFAGESVLLSLISVLPAAALTWLAVRVMGAMPSLSFSMVLPWQAVLAVWLVITAYYLAVCLLPVLRLLRLPPARLAGRYDM
ncbi:MAG: ATP-binding cassette domain-containing protein [Candidatus Enterenecus sp.]